MTGNELREMAERHHERGDPHFHYEAPGENWGAALHPFRSQEKEASFEEVLLENVIADGE